MRIVLCTKRDLVGAVVLNQMLPRLAGDTVMVLLSDKTRPVEQAVPELAEIKFLERDLPVDTLFPLIDRTGGEGALATFDGVARRFGVPVKVVHDINGTDGEALVRDFAPDLMVSVRFSLIFKRNLFDIPRYGTYNVHPGALPRYAGLFAPFRCLVEGDEAIGCTLHRVDDGIDTGPVVGIGWLPVDPARSLLWHVVGTYGPGLDLLYGVMDGLRAGRPPELAEQDRTRRAYASLPDAQSFAAFRSRGLRLYDPKEYMDILNGFLPAGGAVEQAAVAGLVAEGMGASCCCAHA
ncbi:formyl transferase [Magnetospirillum sp. UT-4]|uniref:formyl transferase n=1 Tax=Magnetospirillum sp. UT-4 TaxID=2681467 RepID=UPI0013854679|nr:formyl transferase [Magnetospirillum sp. UT-4]CAA7612702.1 putative methionyl-tRNA formyltransferase [Magnetospirillum sp. UT-4]